MSSEEGERPSTVVGCLLAVAVMLVAGDDMQWAMVRLAEWFQDHPELEADAYAAMMNQAKPS